MQTILTETKGHIGILKLNRPEMRNAFTADMYRSCCDALHRFAADPTIHVVLLLGEGDDFCTGNDLNEFVALRDTITPERIVDRQQTPSTDMVHVVADFPKPLVAAIKGRCIGWGSTMLLHCDAVVADPAARLFFKFVKMGIVPEGGATRLLQQRIGRTKASSILLAGGDVSAEEAFDLGIVSHLAEAGGAEEFAFDLCEKIAANPPQAVQATKRLIREENTALHQHIDAEFEEFAHRLVAPESQAAFAALLKR